MARKDSKSGIHVEVRNNDVEKAIRVLKKKVANDGLMKEIRRRKQYEKPSEKRNREKAENISRTRKRWSKLDL